MAKNMGPSTELSTTPDVTAEILETVPLTNICCVCPLKKLAIHLSDVLCSCLPLSASSKS